MSNHFLEFDKTKRNYWIFALLTTLVFVLIFYSWFHVYKKASFDTIIDQGSSLSFRTYTIKDVNLFIDYLSVKVLSQRTLEVKSHLVIENNENETLNSTDIIIPWGQEKTSLIPTIFDINIDKDGVIVNTEVQEFVVGSDIYYTAPFQYKKKGQNYVSTSFSVTPINNNLTLIHQFGNIIRLEWEKPILPKGKKDFTITFKVNNLLFGLPNPILDEIGGIIKSSPVNFYPLGETARIRIPLIFPFAKNIDLSEVSVNLPYGYSAIPYEAPKFSIEDLNRELTIRGGSSGFVFVYPPEQFNKKICEDIGVDIIKLDGSILDVRKGCVLKYPSPLITEQIQNKSQRWYLSSEHPAVRNELNLMRFAFNPSFHPQYGAPNTFIVLVDYSLNWWVYFVPILLVALIIIISFVNFGNNDILIKVTALIPFIIALFVYWQESYKISPPLHPNLLDILYLITLYIALSRIINVGIRYSGRVIFPFVISILFMIMGFWFTALQDLPSRVAIAFPIVSFALEFFTIPTILSLYFYKFISQSQINFVYVLLLFLRLLTLAILFKLVYKWIFKKIKTNYSQLNKFLSIYLSFFIIWNFYYFLIAILRRNFDIISFFNNTLFLPIIISILILLQEKIYNTLPNEPFGNNHNIFIKILDKYRKMKISRKNVGLSILLGLMFGLFGFMGSYSANFLWWYQEKHPQFLVYSGIIAIILFFIIALVIFHLGKKWIG